MQKKILQEYSKSLNGYQFSVPELYKNFSGRHFPSNDSTENSRKGLSLVRLVTMKILPQIAQYTGSTRLRPGKRHAEIEVRHCWFEV
jgi:hypothetical protein